MKDFGDTIYSFGCVVAATVLAIGVADYWFGHHQLTAFLSPLQGQRFLPILTVLLVGGTADWHIQESVMEFAAM